MNEWINKSINKGQQKKSIDLPSKSKCALSLGVSWITRQCLRSFLRRVVTVGWCIRCHWGTRWCRACRAHTSHCASSPVCGAPDWVSPPGGGTPCLRNTASPRDSGAPGGGGVGVGVGVGGLWLPMGCQRGRRRGRSPGLLESEPGTMAGLGSTRNSLPSRSIQQDNLCVHKHLDQSTEVKIQTMGIIYLSVLASFFF